MPAMPVQRRRQQMSDEVAAHLREEIMSGRLRPGQFVRLDRVAGALGVSVTPVREALAKLRGEDMVTLEPHRGFVVAPLSREDVEDLFWLQADLAGRLTARAAERAGDADLKLLDDLHAELAVATARESIEDLEYRFHRQINLTAGSRKLAWVLAGASKYLPQAVYATDAAWREEMLRSHAEILDALRAGDADQAREAMRAHVLAGKDKLLAHLESAGMWSGQGA
jgi:DNA-binding GntR family transcriptional regulator